MDLPRELDFQVHVVGDNIVEAAAHNQLVGLSLRVVLAENRDNAVSFVLDVNVLVFLRQGFAEFIEYLSQEGEVLVGLFEGLVLIDGDFVVSVDLLLFGVVDPLPVDDVLVLVLPRGELNCGLVNVELVFFEVMAFFPGVPAASDFDFLFGGEGLAVAHNDVDFFVSFFE